ncbi:hypothetical protein AB0F83_18820 [Micromonospora chalcea]|uniref:hypothetical protein n=1 Tax=Micromonospora chalcea TaxID=1874 RepID=UPI0033EF6936
MAGQDDDELPRPVLDPGEPDRSVYAKCRDHGGAAFDDLVQPGVVPGQGDGWAVDPQLDPGTSAQSVEQILAHRSRRSRQDPIVQAFLCARPGRGGGGLLPAGRAGRVVLAVEEVPVQLDLILNEAAQGLLAVPGVLQTGCERVDRSAELGRDPCGGE